MPDAPLETAVDAPETTPSPAPASKPAIDVEAKVKAAVAEARREAQAAKDREIARLHQTHQAETRAIREQATGRMKQLGDTQADNWDQQVQDRRDAEQYRLIQDQAQTYQQQLDAWNGYANGVAQAHGLSLTDARLNGARDGADLLERAKKAMAEDVEKERKRLLSDAQTAKTAAIDQQVAAGDLDTLNGAPAGSPEREAKRKQLTSRLQDLLKNPAAKSAEIAKAKAELQAVL